MFPVWYVFRPAVVGWVVCSLVASAQTPDSAATQRAFWKRFQYKLTTDGTLTTGNVERLVAQGAIVLQYQDSLLDWSLNPIFQYGELTQTQEPEGRRVRTVQEREYDLNAHLGLFSNRKLYGFGFGSLEQSRLRAVDFRWLAGVGMGWHMVRTETHKLTLTAAILYEATDFGPPEEPDYRVLRGSTRLKGRHSFLNDRLRFTHLTNWLPGLRFDGNTRLNTQLGLELPLSRYVSVRAGFEYGYESLVAPGRRREDTRTLVGLLLGNF